MATPHVAGVAALYLARHPAALSGARRDRAQRDAERRRQPPALARRTGCCSRASPSGARKATTTVTAQRI
ncbi:hypothetical protein ACWGE0_15050 [Lentzea sp. NPDC054927]